MSHADPPFMTVTSARDAFDPFVVPERYAHVRRRRIMAFVIDFIIVCSISLALWTAVFLLGVITFGLAWGLLGLVFPGVAILYSGFTMSGPAHGTIGMRAAGLEARMWYGEPVSFIIGAAHVVFFYVSVTVLTPFVLLVSLFDSKKRLLHDLVLGTVVMNTAREAAGLRR